MVNFAKLSAPFPPSAVSWRVGSTTADKKRGLPLCYIDARDVMDRLDEVCGPEGWQRRYSHVGDRTCCEISIKIGDEWVTKADGAGDTDYEAEKGAFSDAFKRAAVSWGIGRYLYGLKAPWVMIEPAGKSYKIVTDEYPKLYKLLPEEASKHENPLTQQLKDSIAVEQKSSRAAYDMLAKQEHVDDPRFNTLLGENGNPVFLFKKINGNMFWKRTAVKEVAGPLFNDLDAAGSLSELESIPLSKDNALRLEVCKIAVPVWFKEFERRYNLRLDDLKSSDQGRYLKS